MTSTPDISSYSQLIRDALVARLQKIPTFASIKTWGQVSNATRIQPNDLPYFGIFEIDGTAGPDGDANCGWPAFIPDVKLGFSLFIQDNDETNSRINLDVAKQTVMNYLRRPLWHRFPEVMVSDYRGILVPLDIEAVTRVHWKYSFGNTASDNETPLGELRLEWTLRYREHFPPIIPDELERINVKVAYPWPYDPAAEESFVVEYDFTVNNPVPPPQE